MNRNWVERDFYAELEVSRHASRDEIKTSYHRLARKFHPDANPSNPSAETKFKRISEAYSVLSRPERREEYDQLRQLVEDFGEEHGLGEDWWEMRPTDPGPVGARTQYRRTPPPPPPQYYDYYQERTGFGSAIASCIGGIIGLIFALILGFFRLFLFIAALAIVFGILAAIIGGIAALFGA